MAQLLDKPGQIYRVIIHTLANADYQPSLERVRKFTQVEDEPTRSAAIATVCRFTGRLLPNYRGDGVAAKF